MSQSHRFPAFEDVGVAYGNILMINDSLDSVAAAREEETEAIRALDASFGWPSADGRDAIRELDKRSADNDSAEADEILAALYKRHGRLFSVIGIEFRVTNVLDPSIKSGFFQHNRIVPDVTNPNDFVTYLEGVGAQEIYVDHAHHRLAKDVVMSIYEIIGLCDEQIADHRFAEPNRPNPAVDALKSCRAKSLLSFCALSPLFSEAGFHTALPQFDELQSRVHGNRPTSSL